jgi:hypothetical protein
MKSKGEMYKRNKQFNRIRRSKADDDGYMVQGSLGWGIDHVCKEARILGGKQFSIKEEEQRIKDSRRVAMRVMPCGYVVLWFMTCDSQVLEARPVC